MKTRTFAGITLNLAVFLLSFCEILNAQVAIDKDLIPLLIPNQTTEREMTGSETQKYRIELKKDEFIQIKVEQKGIDVALQLTSSEGKELATMDSPTGNHGVEVMSFVAPDSGIFILIMTKSESESSKGSYRITLQAPRVATESDIKQVLKEKEIQAKIKRIYELIAETNELKDSIPTSLSTKPFEEALKKANQALDIAESIGSKEWKAMCLYLVGTVYEKNGDVQNATEVYEKTEELSRTITRVDPDFRKNQIHTLKNLGRTYLFDGRYQESLEYLSKGLLLYKEDEIDENKGIISRFVADCYAGLGDYSKAESFYKNSQNIFRALKQSFEEGVTLNKWAQIYERQENNLAIALAKYLEAEKLFESTPSKTDASDRRAFNLIAIARVYEDLKDFGNRNLFQEKAAKIAENVSDPKVLILSYLTTASKLHQEKRFNESVAECERIFGLTLKYKFPDVIFIRSTVYMAMVSSLYSGKDFKKAKAKLNEWFEMIKDLPDKTHLALFYNKFGSLIPDREAIDYYAKGSMLILSQDEKIRPRNYDLLAQLNNKLAFALLREKKSDFAVEVFKFVLAIKMAFGDKNDVGEYLANLMGVNNFLERRQRAAFFGKLSVFYMQEFRRSLKKLSIEDQKIFLAGNRALYESLVVLLCKQNRLEEAQQLISIYADQEFYDLESREPKPETRLNLTKKEEMFWEKFLIARNEINEIGRRMERLKSKRLKRALKSEEEEDLNDSAKKFQEKLEETKNLLEKIDIGFSKTNDIEPTKSVKEAIEMREALEVLNSNPNRKIHVSIFTFIVDDSLEVLLFSGEKDYPIKAFSFPIGAELLRGKVDSFLKSLEDFRFDPLKKGNELYKVLFQSVSTVDKRTTLEAELLRLKADVIHWSLDQELRYIPIAALVDDSGRYVVEKYETAVFTRSRKEAFIREPQKWTSCLGLGTTKAHKNFRELSWVAKEAKDFCNPGSSTIKGQFFLDNQFDLKRIESLNSSSRPPLLHLSTHFKFEPGDAQKSFLLLGDGTHFSLYDMQKYPDLFRGVDLLTASACETGGLQANSNGKEIDAFAELAQRLGANSVIATLWTIDDSASSQLMTEFYRLYSQRIKKDSFLPTKSQLLREAQLNLLRRTKKQGAECGGTTKSDDKPKAEGLPKSEESFTLYKPRNPDAPCEHPYFWAPFVLYGGSR